MKEFLKELTKEIEKIEEYTRRIAEERKRYREGSPYECFLTGVIQGIHYVLNYPRGAIVLRVEIEGESKVKDLKSKEC